MAPSWAKRRGAPAPPPPALITACLVPDADLREVDERLWSDREVLQIGLPERRVRVPVDGRGGHVAVRPVQDLLHLPVDPVALVVVGRLSRLRVQRVVLLVAPVR